jgi:hypothetical protein
MAIGMDQPKGNVYNDNEFNSEPIFPRYMEDAHSKWLGFVPPTKDALPLPFFDLSNAETLPTVGVEYRLTPYLDYEMTQKITMSQANAMMQEWKLKGDGFDYKQTYDKGGVADGIVVLKTYPCTFIRTLLFQVVPMKKLKYFEMASVTGTMNSVFDTFIEDIDRFASVRSIFNSLTDIRRLENINVKS